MSQRRTNRVARLIAIAAGSLVIVPGVVALAGGTALADSSSRVTFGDDEGAVFVNRGNGSVWLVRTPAERDAIASEGTVPTGARDVIQTLFEVLTGADLPISVDSWLSEKGLGGLDSLLTPDLPEAYDQPEEQEFHEVGPVSQNDDAESADASSDDAADEASDDTMTDDGDGEQNNDSPEDCTTAPCGQALPNPGSDTDGPHGPAYDNPAWYAAVPTDDGGPMNPLSRVSQVTIDSGGPDGPAVLPRSRMSLLGALR